MNYGNKGLKILWKASAHRLGQTKTYNDWLFEYNKGKVSFKAETQQKDEFIQKHYDAIYQRRNGGNWTTSENSIFRRSGALWIHGHALSQILREVSEDSETYPLYVGELDKLRVQIIRRKERAIALIVRNWANPLHNSQLPRISDGLREAEIILKKQGITKIFKVLMTESIENKGYESLDTSMDIIFYPVPYITPTKLDDQVQKNTGIPIRSYYPALERWSKAVRSLLRDWIKRLLKVKKKAKQIIKKVDKRLITQFQAYLKLRMEGREGFGERTPKRSPFNNDEQKHVETPTKILHLAPPSPIKPLPPQRVQIFEPKSPFKVRVYTFFKRNRLGILKKYSSLVFYKVRFVVEKRSMCLKQFVGNKHIRLNVDTYKDLYGVRRTLNDCAYALQQYSPRDGFKMRERDRLLKMYLHELARV